MGSVVRAAVVHGLLLVFLRIAGKRSLAQITTFDAVLLLIISEATQQAMIDGDESMTNGFLLVITLLVITLLGLDVVMSLLSVRSDRTDRALNDVPRPHRREARFSKTGCARRA